MGIQKFNFEINIDIDGIQIITPFVAGDERGEYRKTFERNIFLENGIDIPIAEIGETVSAKGVIRGLHAQTISPQPKLIRVIKGSIFDVAVDIRKGSPTFAKHFSIILSDENRKMMYIPAGFLHGMMALEDNTIMNYPSFEDYHPEADGGVKWDDRELNIAWPVDLVDSVIVSEKDNNLPSFAEYVAKIGGL